MSDDGGRSRRSRNTLRTNKVPRLGSSRESQPTGPSERRLLVVEHDDDLRGDLVRDFMLLGWDVRAARDLRSGMETAIAQQPAVILTELSLPDTRGFQFARTLRSAVDHDIQLIGVTGLSDATIEEARRAGFDHVLAKPIAPDELDRMLTRVDR